MSNNRYFAYGVDFWRIEYNFTSTDGREFTTYEGPYIKEYAARRVMNRTVEIESRHVKKYSGRIQKLEAARLDCLEDHPLCMENHGWGLKWVDVE